MVAVVVVVIVIVSGSSIGGGSSNGRYLYLTISLSHFAASRSSYFFEARNAKLSNCDMYRLQHASTISCFVGISVIKNILLLQSPSSQCVPVLSLRGYHRLAALLADRSLCYFR